MNLRLCVVAAVIVASAAHANVTYGPPGLAAGDTYQLIFVTDDTILGNDSNIADYNSFVTTEANTVPGLAALNTTWTALLSTANVNVLANTGLSSSDTTTLFYNTQGQLIATGVVNGDSGLFDDGDGFNAHGAAIFDPNGISPAQTEAWTGLQGGSDTADFFAVGDRSAVAGSSTTVTNAWASDDAFSTGTGTAFAVYAISGILTVSSAPEPSTLLTGGLSMALLLFAFRRR
jgi:hypothetical protein